MADSASGKEVASTSKVLRPDSPQPSSMPVIRHESITLFQELAKEKLTALNYGSWFESLDLALIAAQLHSVLFMIVGGSRIKKPDDATEAAFYVKCNGLAATWIKLAASKDHSKTCAPFLATGDGVGMYDALRAKFSKSTSTTRHNAVEKLLTKWKNPLPGLGTDWQAEYHSLDESNKALKSARKNKDGNEMSYDDLVDEISLYTLMHRIEEKNDFHKKLVSGIKDEKVQWDLVCDDLVHHMEMLNFGKSSSSSVQHANLTQQISQDNPHLVPSRAPSPSSHSFLTQSYQPVETGNNEQANASTQVKCFCCGGPHLVSTCQYVKLGQQYLMSNVRNNQGQGPSFGHSGPHFQGHNRRGGTWNRSRGRGAGTYDRGHLANATVEHSNAAQESFPTHDDVHEGYTDLGYDFAVNASALLPHSDLSDCLIADSGASTHMVPTARAGWVHDVKPTDRLVKVADGKYIRATGVGVAYLFPKPVPSNVNPVPYRLTNVLIVPKLANNLISITRLCTAEGFCETFGPSGQNFYRDSRLAFTANIGPQGVPILDATLLDNAPALSLFSSAAPLEIWHRRLNHRSLETIRKLQGSSAVRDFVIKGQSNTVPLCVPCVEGKLTRAHHTKPAVRASEPLQRVFSDVHGPVPVGGRKHERYWVTFIDDFSGHATIYVVRNKSDVLDCFKTYVAWASNQMKRKAEVTNNQSIRQNLMILRDDKGGEYVSNEFERFCNENGIQREHTIRDTPQQNGRAERFNRFVVETLISYLSQSKLPPSTWPDAVSSIVHVYNRTPSSSLNEKTPFELWTGVPPSLSMIRTWGCLAYIHLQPDQRDNSISSHAVQAVFVGYAMQYKGWKFVNLQTGKDVITDSAVWLESEFPGKLRSSSIIPSPIPNLSLFLPSQDSLDRQPSLPIIFPSNNDNPLITTTPHDPLIATVPSIDTVPNENSSPPPSTLQLPIISTDTRTEADTRATPSETNAPRLVFQVPDRPPIPVEVPLGVEDEVPPPPEDTPAHPSTEVRRLMSNFEHFPNDLPTKRSSRRAAPDYAAYGREEPVTDSDGAFATSVVDSHDFIPILDGPDYVFSVSDHLEPRSLKDALKRPDAEQWFKAACDEIRSLVDNGTWKLVQLPFGRSAVGSRWVFKAKRDSEGKIERYKGRLVAKGYLQRPGIDYDETFAPTTSLTAIRSVMALAALEDWELESVDISTAFLNGDMDRKVYMNLPEGIRVEHDPNKHDEGTTEWVLETIKSIYGFKQAGNRWNAKLHEVLSSLGFVRTETDASTYIYERDGASLIVPIYVDDLTIAGRDMEVINQFKTDLAKFFKIRDLGPTSFVLGLKVERDRKSKTLAISQCAYISDIIESYFKDEMRLNSSSRSSVSLDFLNPASTPALPSSRLTNEDKPAIPIERDVKRAQEITGKLIYLQRGSRPDIAYSLHQICRFTSNPGPSVMGAIKQLLRYLKGTRDLKMVYSPVESDDLFRTYSDSDLGGDPLSCRSTGGFNVMIGSGSVAWSSRLQKSVSLSSTEAEYVNASITGCEMMWMRAFLEELGYNTSKPSPLFLDSNSAAQVVKNPSHISVMKQVHRRYNWIKEKVEGNEIAVMRIASEENPADIFTKPLAKGPFARCRTMLGLRPITF